MCRQIPIDSRATLPYQHWPVRTIPRLLERLHLRQARYAGGCCAQVAQDLTNGHSERSANARTTLEECNFRVVELSQDMKLRVLPWRLRFAVANLVTRLRAVARQLHLLGRRPKMLLTLSLPARSQDRMAAGPRFNVGAGAPSKGDLGLGNLGVSVEALCRA